MRRIVFCVFLISLSQFAYSGIAKDADIARDAFHHAKYKEAFRLFKALAESGEAPEQFYLAEMLKKGQGTEKNKKEAGKWYAKAENRGITTRQEADRTYHVRARLLLDEIASDEKILEQKQIAVNRVIQKKEREAKKLAEAKRLAEEERRKSTPEYKRQQALNKQQKAIETISDARFMVNAAQNAIDHENRIGERTGYVNASLIHEAGSYLVTYEDVLKQSYKEYRQLGGKLRLKDIE